MHNFQTVQGNEITVGAPKPGDMLAANAIEAWQPVEANTTEVVKVLTQKMSEMPCWRALVEVPDNQHVLQQEAIADPQQPDFGMPAIQEMQFILVQMLNVLRTFGMIES